MKNLELNENTASILLEALELQKAEYSEDLGSEHILVEQTQVLIEEIQLAYADHVCPTQAAIDSEYQT